MSNMYPGYSTRLFTEIYENLNQPDMEKVKFEVLGVMNDNAPDFPGKSEEIIKEYTLAGFKGIVAGEPANMEGNKFSGEFSIQECGGNATATYYIEENYENKILCDYKLKL